jgi:hypothetical protein
VNPRAGLDDVKKRKFLTLPGLELRPACSQSLYRLRYPGFNNNNDNNNNNNNNNNNFCVSLHLFHVTNISTCLFAVRMFTNAFSNSDSTASDGRKIDE